MCVCVCAGHAAAGVSALFLVNYMQTFYWQSRMAVGHFPENYRQLAEGFSWTAFDVMYVPPPPPLPPPPPAPPPPPFPPSPLRPSPQVPGGPSPGCFWKFTVLLLTAFLAWKDFCPSCDSVPL